MTKVAQVMHGETMHVDEIEEEREERVASQLHSVNEGVEWSTDFTSFQLASKYT